MNLSLIRSDPQPARIAPLARLPVFLKLDGRRAVVAGGSPAAAWKAELLAAAGARVDVYAPDPCAELLAVAGAATHGTIAIHARPWAPGDCAGAAIAIGACADDGEAARFATAARAAGVPVNVVDRPAFCDFAFGAIVNRSPLVIGVSTDGAAPVFAQAVRARIETLIPQGFARWAAAAAHWRPRVKRLGARFWRKFVARAIAQAHATPNEIDLCALYADTRDEPTAGSVVVVEAGPGDPELLTLRAVRALQSADVILFDRTIGAGVLDFARREARRLLVDPSGGTGANTNKRDNIATTMIALAAAGRRVVRLCSDAESAESEIAACRAAGFAVEVVRGVLIPPPNREGHRRPLAAVLTVEERRREASAMRSEPDGTSVARSQSAPHPAPRFARSRPPLSGEG
jgi:uroporphyrin-III C-methyltransferase/precorrin-2 dehydrogenase/sirohydrochlorin ferrochelatase